MNRTRIFFYNTMATAIMQAIMMLAGFITLRIVLQYYGSEINGLVSSVNQFISYFNVVEAGLAGASIYALYKPLADNDHKAINGVISASKFFYTQTGYIFVSLTMGLSIIYPAFVKSNRLSSFYVGLLVLILGVNGALEFFTLAKYRVLLSANQKTYVISLATIAQIVLNTVVIIICAMLRVNIVVLRALTLLSIFLRSFILMVYVKSKYKYLDYKVVPNKKALSKRWDALYLQLLGCTQIGAPVILATIFTSLQTVSIYSIYNMILGGINGILSIFISGLSASFGDVIARGENNTLQKAYKEFEFSYYSLITVVYAVSLITIMPFIKIYTNGINDINYNLPLLGFLFVLNGFLYNIKTPQGMLVISAGMYKETRNQSTVQAVIIIVSGIVLAHKWGLVGIMMASCISNIYRDIDLMIFIPRKVTKLPIQDTALRILRMVFEMIIVWFTFEIVEINIKNIIDWLIFTFIVGIYSIVIVCVFGIVFDRLQLRNVIKRIKAMIMRR